jgi:uncharacterized RDD family membrane protein YckC
VSQHQENPGTAYVPAGPGQPAGSAAIPVGPAVSGPFDQPGHSQGQPLASWGLRVVSYIVDGIVGCAVAAVAFVAGILISGHATTRTVITAGGVREHSFHASVSGAGAVVTVVGLLLTVAVGAWNRWYLGGVTGRSVGKRVMKLRLIDVGTGQPIGPARAFARDVAHALDSLACYVGWLWPLWDARRQTFADKIISSVVVRDP